MKNITALLLILVVNTSIKAQIANDSITLKLTELSENSNLAGFMCGNCK